MFYEDLFAPYFSTEPLPSTCILIRQNGFYLSKEHECVSRYSYRYNIFMSWIFQNISLINVSPHII